MDNKDRKNVSKSKEDIKKSNDFIITFVTGNQNKLREVQEILNETNDKFPLRSELIDLPELQGEPEKVSVEKCKIAAQRIKGPVIIEDTCLCFNAFKNLPGPYIKWFLDNIGPDGLYKLLTSFTDKSGYALCTFSFALNEEFEPVTFVGRLDGTIVEPRSKGKGFGWDPIFQPEGYDLTFGEMENDVKNKISHRRRSVEKLRQYLLDNPSLWKK